MFRCDNGNDKVWVKIMTNDDNLESNSTELLVYSNVFFGTSVYCPVAEDELTVKVLHDLALQVNLFSRKRE